MTRTHSLIYSITETLQSLTDTLTISSSHLHTHAHSLFHSLSPSSNTTHPLLLLFISSSPPSLTSSPILIIECRTKSGGFDTDVTDFFVKEIFEKVRRAEQEDVIIPEHLPDTVEYFDGYDDDENPFYFKENKRENFDKFKIKSEVNNQIESEIENEDEDGNKIRRYHNYDDGDGDGDSSDDEDGQIKPYLSKRVAYDQNFHKKKFEKPVTQKLSFFLPKSCFQELRKVGEESRLMMFDIGEI